MKINFMGSVPTYARTDEREISDQEKPFLTACEALGYVAASRGHTILASDDHPASADFNAVQGVVRYINETPDAKASIEINRAEGSVPIFESLPPNIQITRKLHPDIDPVWHGTLLPNLAALESADVLVLLGGRLTVKLMGQIAAEKEKPVIAIPSFGGTAVEIYESMRWIYRGLLKDRFSDLAVLRSAWRDDSAGKIVDLADALAQGQTSAAPHAYFISYVWKNSDLADHVEVLLHRFKRAVNRDESIFRAGVDLSDVVRSLINESDTFIGLWNADFKESTWCPQELEYAFNRQHKGLKPTRVVLLMTDDSEPPIRFTNKLRMEAADRTQRELCMRRLIAEEENS